MNAIIWNQEQINNVKSLKSRGLDFKAIANNYDTSPRVIKSVYIEAVRASYGKENERNFESILQEFSLKDKEFKSLMMEYITEKFVKTEIKTDGMFIK